MKTFNLLVSLAAILTVAKNGIFALLHPDRQDDVHKPLKLPKMSMPALLAGSMACAPRGVFAAPRNDGGDDPKAMFAALNKAVTELRQKNEDDLKAALKDVVLTEQIDKINSAVGDLQSAMELQARKLEAAKLGGSEGRIIADPEYTAAVNQYMRDEHSRVEASLKKVPDSAGGFLVPIEWDRTIVDRLKIVSPGRTVFNAQDVSGTGFKKVFNQRGQVSGWVGETDVRPESGTSTFGSMTYTFGELYANPAITQQMLDDGEFDMEAWLAGEVDTELAQQESIAFISGDGVNKPTGLLTYVTGGANAAAHPFGSVKLTASGTAGLFPTGAAGSDLLTNAIYGLPTELGQAAGFIANRNTIKIIRLLKDGQGNYLWQPSYQAGEPASVGSYPIREYAAMPDIAANSVPILFGDFKRAYSIFDRKGTMILRDPFTNKPFVHFYTTKRLGGGLINPEFVKGIKIQSAALDF